MTDETINDKINQLIQQVREESIGSIDPAINARAVALGSSIVRERITELIERGGRITSILPVAGSGLSPNDFALKFEIEFTEGDIEPSSLVVWVDLPARSVKRVTNDLPHDPQLTAPFTIMAPSGAPLIRTPIDHLQEKLIREFDFIHRLKLDELLELLRKKGFNLPKKMGYGDTQYNTPVGTPVESGTTTSFGTASETGGTYDDTQPDTQYDSLPERTTDYETDYKVDTV